MAHVIDHFPEPQNLGRPKGSKYDAWLDGQIWTLHKGEDFEGEAHKFVRAMRQHANTRRNLGLRATITMGGAVVIVQAREKTR
jgi:hypothetical protein